MKNFLSPTYFCLSTDIQTQCTSEYCTVPTHPAANTYSITVLIILYVYKYLQYYLYIGTVQSQCSIQYILYGTRHMYSVLFLCLSSYSYYTGTESRVHTCSCFDDFFKNVSAVKCWFIEVMLFLLTYLLFQ